MQGAQKVASVNCYCCFAIKGVMGRLQLLSYCREWLDDLGRDMYITSQVV
jgi:hypothetical protein